MLETRSLVFACLLALVASPGPARADEVPPEDGAASELERSAPYVAVTVGVELRVIEGAARDVAASVGEMATSVRQLADSPTITEEQQAELLAVLERVDLLSGRVVEAVERLPGAVEASREPVSEIMADLAWDVRLTVVLALVAALLVLVLALVALYLFTLRPTARMLGEFATRSASLVGSLEQSVGLVARTNEAQLELARVLDAQIAALDSLRPEPEGEDLG